MAIPKWKQQQVIIKRQIAQRKADAGYTIKKRSGEVFKVNARGKVTPQTRVATPQTRVATSKVNNIFSSMNSNYKNQQAKIKRQIAQRKADAGYIIKKRDGDVFKVDARGKRTLQSKQRYASMIPKQIKPSFISKKNTFKSQQRIVPQTVLAEPVSQQSLKTNVTKKEDYYTLTPPVFKSPTGPNYNVFVGDKYFSGIKDFHEEDKIRTMPSNEPEEVMGRWDGSSIFVRPKEQFIPDTKVEESYLGEVNEEGYKMSPSDTGPGIIGASLLAHEYGHSLFQDKLAEVKQQRPGVDADAVANDFFIKFGENVTTNENKWAYEQNKPHENVGESFAQNFAVYMNDPVTYKLKYPYTSSIFENMLTKRVIPVKTFKRLPVPEEQKGWLINNLPDVSESNQ